MKKLTSIIILLCSISAFAQKDNRIVIGTADTVSSSILKEKRVVYVHVPAGDKEHFPVLYVLDGEDHFQSAVAINEQMSGLIPPMIVVGITNTNRERDLTPTHVKADKLVNEGEARQAGGGESFMSFIEKELIPYIDSHYPTTSYRVISGHSLGGLTVINALFNHPNLFKGYIAIDPSIWWDGRRWIRKYEAELSKHDFGNKSLFVAIANNIPAGYDTVSVLKDTTGLVAPVTQAVLPFVHALRDAKPAGLRWSSKFYPNQRHGNVELIGEYDGQLSLFSFYRFDESQFDKHPEMDQDSALAAHYKRLSEIMGYKVEPSEYAVNEMAYGCMGRHRMDIAYKLFIRNTQNHPTSSNAFDSLGDYYSAAGDKKNAIAAYSKSLSLQETEDTRRKLNDLKK